MKTDVLIVGSGCSGLYCALRLPREMQITIITKSDLESSDSFLAQGGICVLKDESDYDAYFEDTMRAGHYENDKTSVDIMLRSSQQVISDLVKCGVMFERGNNGDFLYTKEGAHSNSRILFHKDITGKEITSKLLAEAKKLPNVTMIENTALIDIIERDNICFGTVVRSADGNVQIIESNFTVLATGGIGGLFRHSTNFNHLTGDALAIAVKHGIELENINYIQVHPTTFYSPENEDRSFLISESVRGEGAKLYGKNMRRFTDELLPRDKLTAAIFEQMKKDGTEFVWEDLRTIPQAELHSHFPNIMAHCAEMGYDVTKECIPVVPAQHYFMGGIKVNYESRTTMNCLYAVGETACNRVHGRNRLASNSLLESMVFAGRAADDIIRNCSVTCPNILQNSNIRGTSAPNTKAATAKHASKAAEAIASINPADYKNYEAISEEYRKLVLGEIEKADKNNIQ